MTVSSHLSSLAPPAVREWNASSSVEQTIDVACWHEADLPPIRNVRLRFSNGRLADHSFVPEHACDRILPLAVIPPLVNAHTHLEFSALTEPIGPSSPFPEWIRSVIRWRIDHPDTAMHGIQSGLSECRNYSVAAIGEITTSDDAVPLLKNDIADTQIVSFRELIGLLPDQISDQITLMNRHLDHLASASENGLIRAGISPHAPYSVNPDLFTAAVDACRFHSVSIAMHLAETTDELQLLDTGTGHFTEFLKKMNQWDPDVLPRGGTVLSYLEQLAKLPRTLAIHCNYLTDKEILFLGRQPQITVVYCPRTHNYFGHPPHSWQQIQAAGGSVILGTDGRSSNPDLSIWKELQFLASHSSDAASVDLLPMVTTRAAAALRLDCHRVSDAGFNAAVIELPTDFRNQDDPLLSPDSRPVARLVSDDNAVSLQLRAAVDENSGC